MASKGKKQGDEGRFSGRPGGSLFDRNTESPTFSGYRERSPLRDSIPKMEDNQKIIKSAIQHQYDFLADKLPSQQLIGKLVSKFVLSFKEKQHLSQEYKNKGRIAQTETMIDYIVEKDEAKILLFLDILKEVAPDVHGQLDETIHAMRIGKITLYGGPKLDIKKVTSHLKQTYPKPELQWRWLEPIPAEEIRIDVGDEDLMMRPIFKVKRVSDKSKASLFKPMAHLKEELYEPLDLEFFEDVFKQFTPSGGENTPRNLILCQGIAGVGKTSLCQSVAYNWANWQNEDTKSLDYDAVFLLPVREMVDQDKTICDILSDLRLLPKDLAQPLNDYLTQPNQAERVLFVVDGADEQDLPKEVEALIKGTQYPGSHVLVTARPEAKSLRSIPHLTPHIMVELQGTSDDSARQFMSKTLQGKPKAIIENVYDKLNVLLHQFMSIPLYLTLMCFIISEYSDLKDFQPPTTMTGLFNSFFNVIIRRWMKRKVGTEAKLLFEKSPLNIKSTVPTEIQRILLSMARMCFYGLLENKYEFSANDLKTYLLSDDDITESGLFCVSGKGDRTVFFLKHKQLQEYLAAVYLSTDQNACSGLFQKDPESKSLVEFINDSNLIKAIQFACGMSSQFLRNLLKIAAKNCAIIKNNYGGAINIYYESSLLNESNVEESLNNIQQNNEKFSNYIKSANLSEQEAITSFTDKGENQGINLGNKLHYEKALSQATSSLLKESPKTVIEIIRKFYQLIICQEGNSDTIYHEESGSESVSTDPLPTVIKVPLDQFLVELLSMFHFTNTNKIIVRSQENTYIDLRSCLVTFPALQTLDVVGDITWHDQYSDESNLNKAPDTNSVLENIHMYSNNASVTEYQAHYLIMQQQLQSLWLLFIDLLSALNKFNIQPHWSKLVELKLIVANDNSPYTEQIIKTLSDIISCNAQSLQTLSLQFEIDSSVTVDGLIHAIKSVKQLKRLHIGIGSYDYTDKVLKGVSDMTCVKHLVMDRPFIEGREDQVIPLICNFRSVKSVLLLDFSKDDSYSLPSQYEQTLRLRNMKLCVWNLDLTDWEAGVTESMQNY